MTDLQTAWETARTAARLEPTVENRERAKAAWAALVAATPRQKVASFASRAGKRHGARSGK